MFKQICGDERRYLQILINFLSNAIKFSPRDSNILVGLMINEVTAKTEVISEEPEDENQINTSSITKHQILFVSFDLTIQDYGYGMSPESES